MILGADYTIRPLASGDEAALHAAVRESIASLSWWFPWCRPTYGVADAAQRIRHCTDAWKAGTEYGFGIFRDREGVLLGCVGLNAVTAAAGSANLGYWIGEPYRGQGIATRAAAAVAEYAFGTVHLTELEIVALPQNLPSIAVARRLGARHDPTRSRTVAFQGRTELGNVYVLTPAD